MSKLRKHFITVLAVLFCALLCLSTAFLIPKSKTASAGGRVESQFTTIGSGGDGIYTGSATQKSFNSELLKKLYSAITPGNNDAIYKDVEAMVYPYGTNNSAVDKTAADIYTNNGNKNVSVWFGGLKWDVVYITTVRKSYTDTSKGTPTNAGDIVLDLYLSSDQVLEGENDLAQFSLHGSNIGYNVTYPDNNYGRSYIRAVELNAGGYYSKDTGTLYPNNVNPTNFKPISSNRYARFTMKEGNDDTSVVNSLRQFIVQPKDIEYQETEVTSNYISNTKQCPNDAYGQIDSNGTLGYWSGENNVSMAQTRDGYSDWQEDYVWLPSLTETGNNETAAVSGIWKTNSSLRSTISQDAWLRSGHSTHASTGWSLMYTAGWNIATTEKARAVRPAIHFNLTKAEEARGIDFGTDDTSPDTDGGVKFEELKKTYTGDEFTLDIPDYGVLDFNTVTDGNVTSTEVNNIKGDGKFKATKPATDKAKTYAITATPKTGKYWDDTANATNPNDRTATRQYRITIDLAEISVDWDELNVAYGASLLGQDTTKITSPDLVAGTSFSAKTIEYILVTPDDTFDSGSPPTKEDTKWSSTPSDSTATAMGTYHVWYKITADYHEVEIGYYDVTVGQDSLTVTVTDDTELSGKYGQKDGNFNPYYSESDWLKGRFADKVKIETGSNTYATSDDVLDFIDDEGLEVVLLKSDGQEAPLNTHSRYDAGDYSIGLKDASGSYSIKWTDNKKPAVKITKKEAKVKIVAKNAGDDLKSVYGDPIVDLEYQIVSGVFDNEALADLKMRYDSFTIGDGSALSETTPAGTHQIKGASRGSNYDVSYDRSDYKIEPRPITLKITDKEVAYGTDLTDYKFEMTITSGSLVGSDELDDLTVDAVFTITYNSTDADKSNLFIGEYEVNGTVPTGNYIFTVDGGKLTVTKKNFDMSGVKLISTNKLYDGTPKLLQITGDLPSSEISVSYRYVNTADGSESTDPPVEVGLYLVYASFTHNDGNYNAIDDKVAYLRIVGSADDLNQTFPPLPSDEDIAAAKQLAEKKAEAKKNLDEEAAAKKEAIEANKDMTAEDKKAAKEEIEKELAAGNAAIDNAKDKDSVDKAYDDGKKEMTDTVELAETKTDAKKDLEKEANDKKDAIDKDPNLTSEEKTAAKAEVDKELAAGKKEIDKSTDKTDVEAAESTSQKKIEDYTEVVQKKGAAKSELDKAAQAKKDAIDNNPDLTEEEKEAAKSEVDKELADGKKAIDDATDVSGIQSAESTTKENIENIKPKHSGSFPWWILAIIAGAILLVTVLIIVIVKRRNADDDDGGYDDYYDDEYDYDEEEDDGDGDEAFGY